MAVSAIVPRQDDNWIYEFAVTLWERGKGNPYGIVRITMTPVVSDADIVSGWMPAGPLQQVGIAKMLEMQDFLARWSVPVEFASEFLAAFEKEREKFEKEVGRRQTIRALPDGTLYRRPTTVGIWKKITAVCQKMVDLPSFIPRGVPYDIDGDEEVEILDISSTQPTATS